MTKIPYIKWEPVNSVHVKTLDEQHRKLFDIVNDLIDEFEMGSNKVLPIIRDLVEYAAVHFHAEHKVMLESKYPDFLKHSREHQQFIDKMDDFLKSYKQQDADLSLKMILYMKEWVFNHTTKLDILYADYLAQPIDIIKNIGNNAL